MSFEPPGDLSGTPLKADEADGDSQFVVGEVPSTSGTRASSQGDVVGFSGLVASAVTVAFEFPADGTSVSTEVLCDFGVVEALQSHGLKLISFI